MLQSTRIFDRYPIPRLRKTIRISTLVVSQLLFIVIILNLRNQDIKCKWAQTFTV